MSGDLAAAVTVPQSIKGVLAELAGTYEVLEENQEGGNGYVFMAFNRVLQKKAVIKFYSWDGEAKYHFEPQSLTTFDSPNVLKVLDARLVDGEWAYFIAPFCTGGSLERLVRAGNIGIIQAYDIASGILNGLTYLHADRCIHRDLKPGNVYLEDGRAVIGDFGSLVRIPDGETVVPASRHSVLYRPPESVTKDHYGIAGDIYQAGVVLYQLLGGRLSVHEMDWLNNRQLIAYKTKSHPDNTIFADTCLKDVIRRGKLLDYESMNKWTPDTLRRIVRRACNVDPSRRYESAGRFLAALAQTRSALPDWAMIDGILTLRAAPTSFRVLTLEPPFRVQKRRRDGEWRNDYNWAAQSDLSSLVREIESRV